MAWYLFQFDWATFRIFFLRFAIAFWIPLTLLLGCLALGFKASHDRSARILQILLWILTVSICAQPILFGPGNNWGEYTKAVYFVIDSRIVDFSTAARDDAFLTRRICIADRRPASRTLGKFAASSV